MNLHIEFCEIWNYGPEFDRVSKIIKKYNPSINITGNEKPPRSGAFEITIEDKLIYSKFETNNFPSEKEIIAFLKR